MRIGSGMLRSVESYMSSRSMMMRGCRFMLISIGVFKCSVSRVRNWLRYFPPKCGTSMLFSAQTYSATSQSAGASDVA